MKVLCGTDIIEIGRIKESIDSLGSKFTNSIFTAKEIEYCEGKGKSKYQHYAARFAAKEAVFKVVSQMLDNKFDISWQNSQIINDEKGNPTIEFLDIEFEKIKSIDISISHCKDYAIATVVALVEG